MTRHLPTTNTVSAMADINVLIIVGLRAASVDRELTKVAADSPADGIALNMFDSLAELPRYRETFEDLETPSSVGDLRRAAAEADAVLIVTTYHGRVPAVVHNAIDWLTRRWDQAALHDKPLAVIGRASGCYSGVWSHQTDVAIALRDRASSSPSPCRIYARRSRSSPAKSTSTTEIGEPMRYKAIAATLGAASLLAAGITAAEKSAKSSYTIDGAGSTASRFRRA